MIGNTLALRGAAHWSILPWAKAGLSDRDKPRSTNMTYPVPQPSNRQYPVDFPGEFVARTVLIKPRVMTVRVQPIHIYGRYHSVSLTDNPARTVAGASA